MLLSVLAMYNNDNTLFDRFQLPTGVVKDDVINNLLMELAEFEVLYSNPVALKELIGFWSAKELPVWTKLHQTTQLEYDPLSNLNRHEEYTDKQTKNLSTSNVETRNILASNKETRNLSINDKETRALTGSNSETRNLTENDTLTVNEDNNRTNSGTDTDKEYVFGFNEHNSSKQKSQNEHLKGSKVIDTNHATHYDLKTNSGTVIHSTSDNGTIENLKVDVGTINYDNKDIGTISNAGGDSGTVENVHTAHYKGSIGVVLTQQMIEAERRVVQFNITDYIIDSFKKRFCILIY